MTRRTRTRSFILAAALALAALHCPSPALDAHAQQPEQPEQRASFEHGLDEWSGPWVLPDAPASEVEALRARWKSIGEELGTTGSEFAGTYHSGGEMRQTFVRWSPGGGFVYLYVYERYAVIDFSYGSVTVTPSEIVFNVEREQQGQSSDKELRATPRRWVAARFGRTNYLVPAEQFADFGDYAAGLGSFNDFNGPCCEFTPFLTAAPRVAPERDFERPSVAARYERFVKRHIEATISWVGRKRRVENYGSEGEFYQHLHLRATLTPVRVSAGRRRGVKPGLLFRLAGEYAGQFLKITRVGPDSSRGVVVRDLDDDGSETCYDPDSASFENKVCPPVAVGASVTTRPR